MLAIIIPFFKLTFFEATLQSLADQTDKRFKVYIGDDASPEDCCSLLQQFEGSFDFTFYRFEDNLGGTSLTQQWERCIALSSNEDWLMILGDDDVLNVNFVKEFYSNFKHFENGYNVIRFGVIKINGKGNAFSDLYENPTIESSKEILFSKKRSSLSEYIFRKNKVVSIGFKNLPLAWWSDVLAVLEFSDFGNIYSINDSYVNVRVSEISISGSKFYDIQKQNATILFYIYLLGISFKKFENNEIDFLYEKISNLYLCNRSNIKLFYKVSLVYLKNKKYKMYIEFLMKILKSLNR